ncbi:DUF4087 domain-containing protein [Aquamicrobium sp. LC103]|uniref:DUF4087 domain-containing protein n=1 Tax=Aquamicrobium sp. LC103 TaxID=1120658 RepID=UPI00063ED2A9|nr:DUF4087 domain-containing protein [Aquamicrobium sp. LC103]TKT81313.1 DUF4087 domain-containing protein [Aquamicrobium sp. LC103]
MAVSNLFLAAGAFTLGLSLAISQTHAAEQRCGWLINPTPGNLFLIDKDATWNITSQMEANGPDAAGAENTPDFDPRQFVKTQAPEMDYGYGCACVRVETNARQERVTRVLSGGTLPLARCKADKSLPSPTG